MKRLHWSVAAIALIGLSLFAYWWQHRTPPAGAGGPPNAAGSARAGGPGGPGEAVAVEVARAQTRDLSDDTTAVGSLRSRQGVMIRPEVSGRIVKLGFRDGQRVRRGQLLVQLDDSLAQAQLSQARAQLDIAQTTLRRNEELVQQGFVTQSVVDQAQANVNVAQAQVALARATADRLRILAPFDGQAGIRAVNVGDYVKDGADIVNLQDASSLYVDFSLPERYAARLKPQQKVAVEFDSMPGKNFTASIEALEPQITPDGRAIAARALMVNDQDQLRAGMFARVKVQLAQRPNAVVVPEEALVPQADRELLIKVVDGPRGPTSRRVAVKTGLRRDGRVEIVSGLAAGDQVVTAGQSKLLNADGRALKVIELARPASDGASAPSPAIAASAARAG